jgi:hypothetical protein
MLARGESESLDSTYWPLSQRRTYAPQCPQVRKMSVLVSEFPEWVRITATEIATEQRP